MIGKEELEELRKKVEPIKKLACHDDADGLTSAALLSYAWKVEKVFSPEDFGVWNINQTTDKGETIDPPDACVDMVPQNPQWSGLCMDHHPGHQDETKRAYKLILGDVPTSVLVYNVLKYLIPQEQRWKVAVGAVGDGQPEIIPTEIWREFPMLLDETVSTWHSYGELKTGTFPLYLRLSAPLNAACKLPGKWYVAYSVLRNARSPWDIMNDPALRSAKDFMDDEKKRITATTQPIQLRNGIRLWKFDSETKIERTLAWELYDKDKKTMIAINAKTGRGSIRGTLALLVYEHLQANGFTASGHAGFGGLKLRADQTFEDVYRCMSTLKL